MQHLIRKSKFDETLNCVCLGSIKPQKNPIETLLVLKRLLGKTKLHGHLLGQFNAGIHTQI